MKHRDCSIPCFVSLSNIHLRGAEEVIKTEEMLAFMELDYICAYHLIKNISLLQNYTPTYKCMRTLSLAGPLLIDIKVVAQLTQFFGKHLS